MLLIKDMVAHKAPPNANGAPTSVNPVNAVNISLVPQNICLFVLS